MHIGFITSEYSGVTANVGGIATSIKNLGHALTKNGVKVTVFVVGVHTEERREENGISIITIKNKKFPGLTFYITRKYYQNRINSLCKEYNVDVLEAADWTGLTAFMKFKVPLVIRLHGSDTYFCHLEGRKQKRKNFWFENNALKNADGIISVSNFAAEKTKELFGVKQQITTIYNGIDADKFRPDHSEISPKSILYFGSVIRKKGVLELAKAFNEIYKKDNQICLRLVGKDTKDAITGTSTLALFQKEVNREALKKVIHIPHIPYEEITSEIAKATVVVLPSFAEAFPMTWLEAMAMEKALVTSNIGWANEMMLDGTTGITIDPREHRQMTEAIVRLIEDKNLAITYGENARKHIIDHFSSEATVKQNIDFFSNIIKHNARS